MSDYALFDMCPLTQVKIGGGGSVGGFGAESYIWQHGKCIREFCRFYTYKFDENGYRYAEGCNLQFLGMTQEEIRLNFIRKNAVVNPASQPNIDSNCSSCRSRISAPAEQVGARIYCPDCNTLLIVPSSSSPPSLE